MFPSIGSIPPVGRKIPIDSSECRGEHLNASVGSPTLSPCKDNGPLPACPPAAAPSFPTLGDGPTVPPRWHRRPFGVKRAAHWPEKPRQSRCRRVRRLPAARDQDSHGRPVTFAKRPGRQRLGLSCGREAAPCVRAMRRRGAHQHRRSSPTCLDQPNRTGLVAYQRGQSRDVASPQRMPGHRARRPLIDPVVGTPRLSAPSHRPRPHRARMRPLCGRRPRHRLAP